MFHLLHHRASLFATACAASVLPLMSACAAPTSPTDTFALAIITGAHANAPKPVALGAVATSIDQAVRMQASAAVVVNSGHPTIVSQGRLALNCNNDTACDLAIRTKTRLLTTTVTGARADLPENNLLAAIALADRALADHHGTKTLDIVDSGLQTVPPLRFQDEGMLAANPQEVADYLDNTHQLPDLRGVDVIIEGLGDTSEPQDALLSAQRSNLEAIWEAILRRAGAVNVQRVEQPLTGHSASGLPPVTPVPVGLAISFTSQSFDLTEDLISFESETAILKDPVKAQETLTDLAERIIKSHATVTLVGATANVGPLDGQRALGTARANAIRTILVQQLHVPSGEVTAEGVGSDWPGYVSDHDQNGQLLPGPAAQNRRVVVNFHNS